VTDYTNELRQNNTRADYIRNVFPTKTFPNHHTISTGVFPEEHGVMANMLYDFDLAKGLNYSFELFHYKAEIHPIWILNEMAGGRSGCMMWPGSNYQYEGFKCSHSRHFNMSEDYNERVDEVFHWILNTTNPPNLVMFYIEEPDTHAHAFGPESATITNLVEKLNNVTRYLHQKIYENNLQDRVNVMHMSDHGMDSLELRNVVDLSKMVSEKVKFFGSTPVLQIVPENLTETQKIYEKLMKEAEKTGKFKVYLDSTLPKRWHFNNKIRTGPITAVADLGYGFQDMFQAADYYERAYKIPKTNTTRYGVHGYDNVYDSMHPFFFAYGHSIRTKNVVQPFDTVDLMHLFCELLDIEVPDYVKGNRENILGILKENSEVKRLSRWLVLGEFK
jgi:ectonucleotide pyrophosphatase/phosphodiesterase family member 5